MNVCDYVGILVDCLKTSLALCVIDMSLIATITLFVGSSSRLMPNMKAGHLLYCMTLRRI